MRTPITRPLYIAIAGFAFCSAAAAQATWGDETTWNFGSGTGSCDPSTCTVGGVTLTVAGFGYDSRYNGGLYDEMPVTDQDPSGLGFRSRNETTSSPNHAFDNRGGTPWGTNYGATNEVLLLDFGDAKINLTSLMVGWSQNDTDVMVFRWDGAATGPTMAGTAGPTSLLAAGWSLVAAKDLDGSNTEFSGTSTDRNFVFDTGFGYSAASGNEVSSWWLVSSYFGAADSGSKLETSSKDYFKLLSFTGRQRVPEESPPPGVPEPATLALAGLALAGLAASRRRQRAIDRQ